VSQFFTFCDTLWERVAADDMLATRVAEIGFLRHECYREEGCYRLSAKKALFVRLLGLLRSPAQTLLHPQWSR